MRVRVTSTLPDLERDLREIPSRAAADLRLMLDKVARRGNQLAKESAVRTARRHGKHYPNAFTVDRVGLVAEYGPDSASPQGDMSFEWGSRNQPPHLDLNHSADIIGPVFEHEVLNVVDKLFW